MALSRLFIEIDADINKLQRSLRRAERELDRAGRKMKDLGQQLTMSLTLPIVGIGAAAVKSAGDLEALEKAISTTMRDAGYSTQQATEELNKLRRAAEAPGLDFEQAVKGSLRLQSVGFAADEARRILSEFGNAVAASGGSAEQLDKVTVQLSQIQSKGRVLNEDLLILKENMPSISKAMVQAFGTADAEGIRKLGISTEEFIKKLTDELADLERVEGGISNSIVNAGVAIKLFLASVGKSLDDAFDVRGTINRFSESLIGLADWFSKLDTGTKKLIGTFALLLAGIGPAIRVMGIMGTAMGNAAAMAIRMQTVFITLSKGGIPALIANFQKLNVVMRANVIGIVITAIAGLALVLSQLNTKLNATQKVQQTVNRAQIEAINNTAKEKIEASRLVKVIQSENTTRAEKQSALDKLKAIQPEIFKGIDLEKSKTEDLNAALQQYIDLIQKRAKVKVLTEALEEQTAKVEKLKRGLEDVKPTAIQTLANAFLSGGNVATFFSKQAQTAAKNVAGSVKDAEKQIELLSAEIADIEQETGKYSNTTEIAAASTKTLGESHKDTKASITEATTAIAGANVELQKRLAIMQEMQSATAISPLAQADMSPGLQLPDFGGFINQQAQVQSALHNTRTTLSMVSDGVLTVGQAWQQFGLNALDASMIGQQAMQGYMLTWQESAEMSMMGLEMLGQAMGSSLAAMGGAMAQAAESGAASFAELGQAALASAGKIVRAFIMEGVAGLIAKTMPTAPFPIGLALGAAAGAAAGALFNRVLGSLKVPALAEGGLAFGPTLAMVGDNPGAAANPEVIAPLDKLEKMFGTGNSIQVMGTTRLSGRDLLIVWEKAQQDKFRVT